MLRIAKGRFAGEKTRQFFTSKLKAANLQKGGIEFSTNTNREGRKKSRPRAKIKRKAQSWKDRKRKEVPVTETEKHVKSA